MSQSLSSFDAIPIPASGSSRDNVLAFLGRFQSRKRILEGVQGLCLAIVVLVAISLLIVCVDATGFLAEQWRWVLTIGAYLVALVVGWRAGLRGFFSGTTPEDSAWEVEQSNPAFRESLMASVQLRDKDGAIASGSPAFVNAIENQVAKQLSQCEIESLLPWGRVLPKLIAVLLCLSFVLGLCAVPGLQFSERLARATIPFLSLAKPSTVRIAIVEPSPESLSVPSEQLVAFSVEVTGGLPDEAFLELVEGESINTVPDGQQMVPASNRVLRMSLESQSPLRFTLTAPIGSRTTRYRVSAGDGQTAWRTITPIPRPKPLSFHSTVHHPEYAQQEPTRSTSLRGDIQGLVGSQIHFDIDVNQSLQKAFLSVEYEATGRRESIPLSQSDPSTSLPLTAGASHRYSVDLELMENARYQLKMVSKFEYKGQPIENSFSPFYKLDAQRDQPAAVSWIANEKTVWGQPPKANESVLVTPDEVVYLAAMVADNLPLESVSQEISTNRGEWLTVRSSLPLEWLNDSSAEVQSLAKTSKRGMRIGISTWAWDLIDLSAESGDVVATRLNVVDRAGNVTYSPEVQFTLANLGFERDRHKSLNRRAELVAPIAALHDALLASRQSVRQQLDLIRDVSLPQEQRDVAVKEVRVAIEKAVENAKAIRTLALDIMPDISQCIDQNELELAARSASRIEKDFLETIRFHITSDTFSKVPQKEIQQTPWFQQDRDEKWNRCIQSHDAACDHAQRLLDIYRQFIGHELQADLTLDLTFLMNHQLAALSRNPKADFNSLSRSHYVSEQYMNSITELGQSMTNSVIADVRDRLNELYRWLDQNKLETRDIIASEESEQSLNQLRARIDRSVNELKYMRWGFNLGGNLIWATIDSRKDLFLRGGTLSSHFDQFFSRHQRRKEAMNDKSLDSEQLLARTKLLVTDATGVCYTSLGQMLDRRDIHQSRSHSDPMFASDMGMAHRAWTRVLEQWVESPMTADESLASLQAIAKAYRILESAHEAVEARLAVQTLRPLEQFEWKSMEAQLFHPKQWDSVPHRLEIAHQWMKEAGFPNAIADKFNSLRWSEPFSSVSSKLHPRRDANNTKIEPAADDLHALMQLWTKAEQEAQPTIDEARATLARFAPTVSELARTAAESTMQLEEMTKRLQDGPQAAAENEATAKPAPASPPPTPSEIQLQQEIADRKTSQLQDALIELARKQNLLNEFELQAAKDSDLALKLVDAVTLPMMQSVSEAMEAVSQQMASPEQSTAPESKAETDSKLAKAVQQEDKAVKALERVADHFKLLEDAMVANENEVSKELDRSREEFEKATAEATREYELQPDSPPMLDDTKNYERAQELAELANSDPESLMKKLEQELKSNAPMKQELSEISKSNLQSVTSELKNAAKTEQSLAKQLESSDLSLASEKRLALEQLRSAADQSERFAARLLNKSSQASSRAGDREASTKLDTQAQKLRSAANAARSLSEQSTRKEIDKTSDQLNEQLAETQSLISEVAKTIEPMVEQPVAKDESKRQNARNDMQNLQNQMRDELINQAREANKQSQQQLEQFQKRVGESDRNLENARKQKKDAKNNFDKNPSDAGAKDWLKRASVYEEQQAIGNSNAKKLAEQSERHASQSKERLESFERSEKANVDKPNPQAALAKEQMDKAKSQVESIQSQLQPVSEAIKNLSAPRSATAELDSQNKQQAKVQSQVAEAASELARSARHEQRLGNATAASELGALQTQIEKVNQGAVQDARDQLQNDYKAADSVDAEQSLQRREQPIEQPFDRPQSQSAQDKLASASNALADQAAVIDQSLGKNAQSGNQEKSNASESENAGSEPKTGETKMDRQGDLNQREQQKAEAKEMARMLDDLDRQLNSPQNDSSEDADSNASQSQEKSSSKSKSDSANSSAKSAKSSANSQSDQTGVRSTFEDSLRASADQLAGNMNQDRLSQRNAKQQAKSKLGNDSLGKQSKGATPGRDLAKPELGGTFNLPGMAKETPRDWGKLRSQRAEDVVEGYRDEFDPEFSQAIQAYYRAMSDKALNSKGK